MSSPEKHSRILCQNCFREATETVTEILNGRAFEIYFCSRHAAQYLNASRLDTDPDENPGQEKIAHRNT